MRLASRLPSAYLLKSDTVKQRLVAARQRQEGISLDAVVEKPRI
jgi:hypothetical protein